MDSEGYTLSHARAMINRPGYGRKDERSKSMVDVHVGHVHTLYMYSVHVYMCTCTCT